MLVFDVVPRAVLLLVSQAPDARHHGRLGPQDSVEVHRCSSWTRFSPCPLLCYVCLGPDSVLHCGVSRSCTSITVFVVAFMLCSLSLSAGPCCQASCTAWTVPWKCSSWTSCSRPSLCYARCRLCPGSARRCPWRHYRCSSWTKSWSLRQLPWS